LTTERVAEVAIAILYVTLGRGTSKFSLGTLLRVKRSACGSGFILVRYGAIKHRGMCCCYLAGWFVRDHENQSGFSYQCFCL